MRRIFCKDFSYTKANIVIENYSDNEDKPGYPKN